MTDENFYDLEDFMEQCHQELDDLEAVFKRQAEFVKDQDNLVRNTAAMIEVLRDKRDKIWDEVELMEIEEENFGILLTQIENALNTLESSYNSVGYGGQDPASINQRRETLQLFDKMQDTIKLLQDNAEALQYEIQNALKEQKQSFPLADILHCHTVALTNLEIQITELEKLVSLNQNALQKLI